MIYKLKIPQLAFGQMNTELVKVQKFLADLNYIEEDYKSAYLDKPTQTALKKYQAFRKLKQSGTTDPATVELLKQPRCGTPDPVDRLTFAANEFVAGDFAADLKSGCRIATLQPVTYTIGDKPDELPNELGFNDIKTAIEKALATWRNLIPIEFQHTQGNANAAFKFKWVKVDSEGLDGIGGILARAFYPGQCGGTLSGQCHFDRTDKWGPNDNLPLRTFDVETVALHEIGHLLGLTHTNNPSSIMIDRHIDQRRKIKDTDPALKAIQDIYGKRNPI